MQILYSIPSILGYNLLPRQLQHLRMLPVSLFYSDVAKYSYPSGGSRIFERGVLDGIKARVALLLGGSGGMPPPQEKILDFWCLLGVKLQKLDDPLLNLVVVFEARRIKGVTPLRVVEAAKQQWRSQA